MPLFFRAQTSVGDGGLNALRRQSDCGALATTVTRLQTPPRSDRDRGYPPKGERDSVRLLRGVGQKTF